jgi:hypothetical protein
LLWLFWRWGSHELFVWAGLEPTILLISASWEAKITDVSHLAPFFISSRCKLALSCLISIQTKEGKPYVSQNQNQCVLISSITQNWIYVQ